tara:strand:+ start:9084 stop:11171 length:2088 start_codon:yes stop_codon:yes gene_type:complete
MEQKSSKFGVFVATLAMIASVLVIPTVSAEDGDLTASLTGDVGTTSYSSEFGNATFDLAITSASGIAHHNVTVNVTFRDSTTDKEWNEHYSTISDCVGDGTTASNVTGHLAEGDTMHACISVMVELSSGEASKEQVTMEVRVTSDEDTTGVVVEGSIAIVNWYASSDDGIQSFRELNEDDADTNVCADKPNCQTYTISVKNIKVDSDDNAESTDETISIRLAEVGVGWNVNSSYGGWNIMEAEATINGLDAGQTLDLVFEVTLVGGNIPATSYLAESYNQIVFEVRDSNSFYSSVTLYATVADNFAVLVTGAFDTYTVDNGCSDDAATVSWDVEVRNYGNTWDTFAISFDLAGTEAEGWDVTSEGGLPITTDALLPKFENGKFLFTLEMTIPAGLDAGTSQGFTMTVNSGADNDVTSISEFAATVEQCYGVTLAIDKSSDMANPGSVSTFVVTATNDGNGEDTIDFTTMGPASWSPMVSADSLTLARNGEDTLDFTLTVPADAEAGVKSGMAMVHAFSEGCAEQTSACEYEEHVSVTVTANQIFAITADYYTNETGDVKKSVELEEGQQVQMFATISNGGNGGDRVTIELVGAPAWVVLSKDTALVSKGGSEDIAIDVRAPASEATGDHTFQVKATSQDGTTTSTTGTLTITIEEKSAGSGSSTETVDEDEGLPGFGAISALAALGVALILRRRL